MNAGLPLLVLLGHAFFWIGLINRLHSIGMRRRTIKTISRAFFALAAVIPGYIGWRWAAGEPLSTTMAAYVALCCAVAPITLARLIWFRLIRRRPAMVRFHWRRPAMIDPADAAAVADEARHHFLTRLPLNENLRLEINQWTLEAPRLPPALDRLSIVHLSDLHFTGRVGKAYFREVARVVNELRPDMICLTGDLIDEPQCFTWIPDTLGQLAARGGVYFILGNHDLRVDVGRLRRTLVDNGLVDLGGRWLRVEIDGAPLVLAGNQRPWFDERGADFNMPSGALRIALAHSPDQLSWARRQGFDLLLAGHTHGGQIRIPPLGAIFTPTFYGVKHVAGVFYAAPTIMHVTSGISGDVPIRWNCPPEIAMLKLRAAHSTASSTNGSNKP